MVSMTAEFAFGLFCSVLCSDDRFDVWCPACIHSFVLIRSLFVRSFEYTCCQSQRHPWQRFKIVLTYIIYSNIFALFCCATPLMMQLQSSLISSPLPLPHYRKQHPFTPHIPFRSCAAERLASPMRATQPPNNNNRAIIITIISQQRKKQNKSRRRRHIRTKTPSKIYLPFRV